MRNLLLIARHEFITMAGRRSFIISTLAVPVVIAAIIGLGILFSDREQDRRPVGVVDQAGVITAEAAAAAGGSGRVALRLVEDAAAARAALEAGEIQAYYVLPPDYRAAGRLQLHYAGDAPGDEVRGRFNDLLRESLAAGLSPRVQQRLEDGLHVTVRSADGRQEFGEESFINILLPILAGLFFTFAVLSSTGYLLQAVTAEKENRTVEIMATSVAPWQLMGGKALGLLAVALSQIALWVAVVGLGVVIGAQVQPVLRGVRLSWSLLAIIVLYFVPAFALLGGIMMAIGAAVTESQQGQQIAGIVNLLFMLPFFFIVVFFVNPDGTLAVALTLFPTTSFLTLAFRWGLTTVPAWQIAVSWLLLVGAAVVAVWVASRVFRTGMLRYGQRMDLQSILATLRPNGS